MRITLPARSLAHPLGATHFSAGHGAVSRLPQRVDLRPSAARAKRQRCAEKKEPGKLGEPWGLW